MINKNETKAMINTDDATATENDILENETAYARRYKLIGNIKKKTEISEGVELLSSKDKIIMEIDRGAYLASSETGKPKIFYSDEKLKKFLQITPEKIIKGNTICGVEGNKKLASVINTEVKTLKKINDVSASELGYKTLTIRGIFDNDKLLFATGEDLEVVTYNLRNFRMEKVNFSFPKERTHFLNCHWTDGNYLYLYNKRYDKNFKEDTTYNLGDQINSIMDIDGENEFELKIDNSSSLYIRKRGENNFKELVSEKWKEYNLFKYFKGNYMYGCTDTKSFLIYNEKGTKIYEKYGVGNVYTTYDKKIDKAIINVISDNYNNTSLDSDIFYLTRDGKIEIINEGGPENFVSSDIGINLGNSLLYLGNALVYVDNGILSFMNSFFLDPQLKIENAGKDVLVWRDNYSFTHYQIE